MIYVILAIQILLLPFAVAMLVWSVAAGIEYLRTKNKN